MHCKQTFKQSLSLRPADVILMWIHNLDEGKETTNKPREKETANGNNCLFFRSCYNSCINCAPEIESSACMHIRCELNEIEKRYRSHIQALNSYGQAGETISKIMSDIDAVSRTTKHMISTSVSDLFALRKSGGRGAKVTLVKSLLVEVFNAQCLTVNYLLKWKARVSLVLGPVWGSRWVDLG